MLRVVVFDTNILISATISKKGKPHRCLRLAEAGKIQSVSCREILQEFADKLLSKFEYSRERAQQAVSGVKKFSQIVEIANTLKVIAADPEDDKILECALRAKATHIVTGDKKHLLPLGNYQGIAIVSATDFLVSLAEEQN